MQQNTNKQGIHTIKCTEKVNAIFLHSDTPMVFSFTCHEIYSYIYMPRYASSNYFRLLGRPKNLLR